VSLSTGWWKALPTFFILALMVLGPVAFDRSSIRPTDPAGSALRPPLSRVTIVQIGSRENPVVVDEFTQVPGGGWQYERRGEVVELPAGSVDEHVPRTFWLGTDRVGRDVLALILRGARTSVAIGLVSALLALFVGSAVGGISGAGPRWVDAVLMRILEALLAFPQLVLVLLLAVLFRPSPWAVVLIVGLTSWMGIARMVRAEILQLRSASFVLAARALGATPARVLIRHLLPNALGPAMIAATLLVGDAILVE
jgi:ABC-type dipeptide/oligopeptide/nickel transport system permease subunit